MVPGRQGIDVQCGIGGDTAELEKCMSFLLLTFKGKYFTLYGSCQHSSQILYAPLLSGLAESRQIFPLTSWTFLPDALRNLAGSASITELIVTPPLKFAQFPTCLILVITARG